jgi:hypothetical protein
MSFLPENYEAPKSGGSYMKLQDGENKIRILSKPILGYIDWKDNKPMRFRMDNKPLASVDPKKPVKHFWAFIIFDYATEEIKILEISQVSIQKAIAALSKDSEWGVPYHYDLKITRQGKDMNTEYFVNPSPHKQIGLYVEDLFRDNPCYLEALFDGADPFDKKWEEFTPGIFKKDEIQIAITEKPKLTEIELVELYKLLDGCSTSYVDELTVSLKKMKINDFKEIPQELYPRIRAAAQKNKEKNEKENEELPF